MYQRFGLRVYGKDRIVREDEVPRLCYELHPLSAPQIVRQITNDNILVILGQLRGVDNVRRLEPVYNRVERNLIASGYTPGEAVAVSIRFEGWKTDPDSGAYRCAHAGNAHEVQAYLDLRAQASKLFHNAYDMVVFVDGTSALLVGYHNKSID